VGGRRTTKPAWDTRSSEGKELLHLGGNIPPFIMDVNQDGLNDLSCMDL